MAALDEKLGAYEAISDVVFHDVDQSKSGALSAICALMTNRSDALLGRFFSIVGICVVGWCGTRHDEHSWPTMLLYAAMSVLIAVIGWLPSQKRIYPSEDPDGPNCKEPSIDADDAVDERSCQVANGKFA